jgi:hypothetical protein
VCVCWACSEPSGGEPGPQAALLDSEKADQINAGTRTADLLHLAACNQAAEIDREIRLGRLVRRCRAAALQRPSTAVIGPRADGGFRVEYLDLRDWPLPIFAEHLGSIAVSNDPTYSTRIVRDGNRKIKEVDAHLLITPKGTTTRLREC